MPNAQGSLVALSVGGINAKTTGTTVLDTTEDGSQRFVPLWVFIECTAATSITVGADLNVGTNAPNYTSLVATIGPTTLNQVESFVAASTAGATSIAPNTEIRVNITKAATGTSQTLRCDVIGYYT
jgi:hypothetical protein